MTLSRKLSAADLVLAGIGATVGAGVFIVTGQAAALHAGPAVVISFAIAAFACGCAALCYAELASAVPRSGSAYSYALELFGRFPAWMIFWCLLLEYGLATSVVAVGFSSYLDGFLGSMGISLPEHLTGPVLSFSAGAWSGTGSSVNLPAVVALAIVTVLLSFGIALSARANRALVAIKIGVIALFVAVCAYYVDSANWVPFIPSNQGEPGVFGWSGVFTAASIVFFSFLGFDATATLAQETRNPERDVPVGIIGSLVFCTALYMLVGLVLTGLLPYWQLNVPNPVYAAVAAMGPPLAWLGAVVNIGALTGMLSVLLVVLLAQSRIVYTVAGDGFLPGFFGKVGARYGTPVPATLGVGCIAGVLAAFFPIDVLTLLISLGTLLAFSSVCMGIFVLRRRPVSAAARFRTPWFPVVPILGLAACGYLMFSIPRDSWARLSVWLAIGIVLYVARARLGGVRLRLDRPRAGGRSTPGTDEPTPPSRD